MDSEELNSNHLYNIIINNITNNELSNESIQPNNLINPIAKQLKIALEEIGDKVRVFNSNDEVKKCHSFSSVELPDLNVIDVLQEYLSIDKLSLTIKLKRSKCKKFLKQLKANKRGKVKKVKKAAKSKYKSSYMVTLKSSRKNDQTVGAVYLGMEPAYSNLRNLKIEFNPSNSRKAITYIFKELTKLVGNDKAERLVKGARITRVDLALDIYGSNVRDLLLIKPRCKYHEAYLSNGGIDTTYHGKRGACRVITYDKRKEMGLSQNIEESNILYHTRIESQFRPYRFPKTSKGVKFKSYKVLPSLLQFIKIFDIAAMPEEQKVFCKIMQLTGHIFVKKILPRVKWERFSNDLKEFEVTLDHIAIKELQDTLMKRELKKLLSAISKA